MNAQRVETVADLYPAKWVTPSDLKGPVTVTIRAVTVEEFYQRKDGSYKPAIVLAFERATKRLILNKSQTFALAQALGTERLADWVGKSVTLSAGTGPTGKPTILITASVREPAQG